PSFEYKGMMGGMAAFKHYVTFGFWKQSLMKDPQGVFEKDRPMASGRLTSVKDLPPDKVLIAYVKEAAALNDNGVKVPRPPRAKVAAQLRVPADLAKALEKNAKAKATFTGFSPSQRNEYVEWLTDAKQDATRSQRLATTIEWLAQGKPRNWKYMRMK
ncbi:MAG TPA: YdeI/OmpD-associated family protein, partial [Gemmatimonadaceae bacterium]